MEKERQVKLLSIVALVLAISAMTLGFAAFSTTLNISSSATVTPSSEDFKIVMSGSSTDAYESVLVPTVTGNATADNAIITNSTNMSSTTAKVNFTEPGQEVTYGCYIHNIGKYTGYFNSIEFSDIDGTSVKKRCTAVEGGGATQALVDAACESIEIMIVDVSGTIFKESISGSLAQLSVGKTGVGYLKIVYNEDGARADGPFTVEFGDIKLTYSSVEG